MPTICDYLYRAYAILVRVNEADRVTEQLGRILDDVGYGDVPEGDARQIRREELSRGLVRLTVPPTPTLVPDLVARLDEDLWPGVAKPDHKVYVCPFMCPATEPVEVPGNAVPVPPAWLGCGPRRPLGRKRRVRRVGQHRGHRADTAVRRQARLARPGCGATRRIRTPLTARATGFSLRTPATGRSCAGVLRCVAPKASVFVEGAFDNAGADYESKLLSNLEDALDRDPDILVFTFTSATHRDQSLKTFDELYDRRISRTKGLVVLAPAGNDGTSQPRWPAAHPGRDRRRRPGRQRAAPRALEQLRPVGRCLRAGRGPRERLPGGNLRLHRAAERRANAGSSTGWRCGVGRRSAPRWSPG